MGVIERLANKIQKSEYKKNWFIPNVCWNHFLSLDKFFINDTIKSYDKVI